MEENEFENIMKDADFDSQALLLSESAEIVKKVVDSAGELYSHAVGIGLPDDLAKDMTSLYFEMILGMESGD